MRTVVGSDHAGYELKQSVAAYTHELGHAVIDVGTRSSTTPVDYPDYAEEQSATEGKKQWNLLKQKSQTL